MNLRAVGVLLIISPLLFSACVKHRPRDKELEAIKLLGDAEAADLGVPNVGPGTDPMKSLTELMTRPGGVSGTIEAACGDSQEKIKKDVEAIVATWLRANDGIYAERPIAPGLPEAAAKLSQLAKPCTTLTFALGTKKHPEIEKIRAVLGSEDSVNKSPVSIGGHAIFIHRYGWIQFQVMDNEVTRLVLDLKNSGY